MFLFDEIDAFKDSLQSPSQPDTEPKARELIDEVLDLLIMAYVFGTDEANRMLGGNVSPDLEEMQSAIEYKIDGEGFRERIEKHLSEGDIGMVGTVADTDSVRVYNTAILNTGLKLGATNKTWHTMEDERVRDTHSPLDNITVPIDANFYTWDGDKAMQPGGFEKTQNNANCRCILTVS